MVLCRGLWGVTLVTLVLLAASNLVELGAGALQVDAVPEQQSLPIAFAGGFLPHVRGLCRSTENRSSEDLHIQTFVHSMTCIQ